MQSMRSSSPGAPASAAAATTASVMRSTTPADDAAAPSPTRTGRRGSNERIGPATTADATVPPWPTAKWAGGRRNSRISPRNPSRPTANGVTCSGSGPVPPSSSSARSRASPRWWPSSADGWPRPVALPSSRCSSVIPVARPPAGTPCRSIGPACVSREFSAFALEEDQPDHGVAAQARRGGARAVRRPRSRRGRHVLHRWLRTGHDGRRHCAGARAEPAVAPVPAVQEVQGGHRDLRRRPGQGEGAHRVRHLPARPALHQRPLLLRGALRDLAPRARRRVHCRRDRLGSGQSARPPEEGALRADRAPRRRGGHAHAGCARPDAHVLPREAGRGFRPRARPDGLAP